jgi:hypothetical protein
VGVTSFGGNSDWERLGGVAKKKPRNQNETIRIFDTVITWQPLNIGIATIKREIAFLRKVQLIERRGSRKTGGWIILFNFNEENKNQFNFRF